MIDENIVRAFNNAIAEGKTKEATKLDMINAGASIGNIHRAYMHLLKENKLYMSPEEKKAAIHDILMPLDLADKDVFDEAIEQISSTVPGISEDKARRTIVRWCKRNNHPCWTAGKRRGDLRKFMTLFLDFISAEETPTEEDVVNFVMGKNGYHPTVPAVKSQLGMLLDIYNAFANIREVG